jgi:hemolysin III
MAEQTAIKNVEVVQKVKPLLRGWFHAVAAVGAVIVTIALCWQSRSDLPRFYSMLIFGLSMVELYLVSAIYHIVYWPPAKRRVWRVFDHANIFILIAGTYTPLCFNVLSGWVRTALLIGIWSLAIIGIAFAIVTLKVHIPRWLNATLYIAMGWVAVLAFPAFLAALPGIAVVTLVLGGLCYSVGAVIYARRRPDPFPRILGYHEIFHLLVIAGGAAFAACVWIWALPFPRS